MRVGDVSRISRMVQDGNTEKEIIERFRNDYVEDEIKMFIKAGKAKMPAAKKSGKSKDPLS